MDPKDKPKYYEELLPKMKRQDKHRDLLPGLLKLIFSLNRLSEDVSSIEIHDNVKAFMRVRRGLIDHEKAVRDYRYMLDGIRKKIVTKQK